MHSKKLTEKEREQIEKMANKILEPIEGQVTISERFTTIYCSRSAGSVGSDMYEWEEYWYTINVKTNKGTHEYGEVFSESNDPFYLARVAWKIGWTIFHKFDNNIHGPLAENLWPKENDYKPNYKKLLDEIKNE